MTKKIYLYMTLAVLIMLAIGHRSLTRANAAAVEANAFLPETVQWGPAPPFVAPGAKLAVLEGNPMGNSGDYTIRLKLPAGYKIAPHWHPLRENVTVISGTFKVGMGDRFDESSMQAFPAGSFAYLDTGMHHFAMAGASETIVQVHGQSPVQFNYVNPEDDPSGKK